MPEELNLFPLDDTSFDLETSGLNGTSDFKVFMDRLDEWRKRWNITVKNSQGDLECDYCSGTLRDVVLAYNGIHGYISLLVCVFGSLANILNVAVLTRRDMTAAPINRLLKWLAVTDVFVMIEYIPFATYKYMILPGRLDYNYSGAVYLLFHCNFTQIFHSTSICLTLSLAIWRYLAIKYSDKSHILCTERRCSIAILSSFLLPPLLCIPTFLVFYIKKEVVVEAENISVLYHIDADNNTKLYHINFWMHAVLIKLLPCLILTVLSIWLVWALYNANQRQKTLRGCKEHEMKPLKSILTIQRQNKANKRTDRTTKMLVAVLLLFLITELPQGILGLLSGIFGVCFFKTCYDLFGELMDVLALVNGAINFVLYCCMSRQFRMTFKSMVTPKFSTVNWQRPTIPIPSHTDMQNTYV